MSTDVIERLAALSPAPPFPADVRRAMLAEVFASDAARTMVVVRRQPRLRRRVLVGAAAGLAVVAVSVPALLPASTPGSAPAAAAAELHRIAGLTAAGVPLAPGQFRYQRETSTQTGVFPDAAHTRPAVTVTDHSQFWTDATGNTYGVVDSIGSDGKPHHEVFYGAGETGTAGLPTDPSALDSYLRAHASGGNSADEAVFSALTDILGSGAATPALRAAAVDVLAVTGHVTVNRDAVDSLGRHVERFDFVDAATRPDEVQSYSFDPDSGVPMGSEDVQPGSHYVSTVEQTAVVSAVPADVVKAAADSTASNERLVQPGSGG